MTTALLALLLAPALAGAHPAGHAGFVGLDLARHHTPWVEGFGVGVHGGYHWGVIGLEARVAWHPDRRRKDLTQLTRTLLEIAHTSSFWQPLDKTPLLAGAALRITPLAGAVEPLDALSVDAAWNLFLGPALISRVAYYAAWREDPLVPDALSLERVASEVEVGATWGTRLEVGLGYGFLAHLDLRWWSWIEEEPSYDRGLYPRDKQLYHHPTWSLGLDLLLGGGR